MRETSIIDLPEEILEKIFLLIPRSNACPYKMFKKISNLTEVCQKFKRVVETSSSLMSLLYVEFDDDKRKHTHKMLKSQRQYKNISIKGYKNITHAIINFIIYRSSITNISICCCSIKTSDLNLIIRCVSRNLETLYIKNMTLINDTSAEIVNLPNLKHFSLHDNNSDHVINYMLNLLKSANNIRKFEITHGTLNQQNEQLCAEAICDANELKELIIHCKNGISQLFQKNYSSIQKTLKLENLGFTLRSDTIDIPEHWPNFLNFLSSQKDYLKKVSLLNLTLSKDVIEILFSMKHLRSLELSICNSFLNTDYTISTKNTAIKNLTICDCSDGFLFNFENTICDMLMNCPNLEELELRELNLSESTSCILESHMKFLKTLTIYFCKDLHPVAFPNIEVLNITDDSETELKFILLNQHIKNLSSYSHVFYDE